jgi:hypothetical protein
MNLTTIRRKRHSQIGIWDSRHMLQIIFYDQTNFFNQRNSGERGKWEESHFIYPQLWLHWLKMLKNPL